MLTESFYQVNHYLIEKKCKLKCLSNNEKQKTEKYPEYSIYINHA